MASLNLSMSCFLFMPLLKKSLAPPSSVPSVCVYPHKKSETTQRLKPYIMLRPACQPQVLLWLMLSEHKLIFSTTTVSHYRTQTDIFSHHGISLQNTNRYFQPPQYLTTEHKLIFSATTVSHYRTQTDIFNHHSISLQNTNWYFQPPQYLITEHKLIFSATTVSHYRTQTDIFNHHSISLQNTIKSNITWFQSAVYLLLIPRLILQIVAYSFLLLVTSIC
jgi:hypothetical protein